MAKYLIIGASSDIAQEAIKQLNSAGNEVITAARSNNTIQPDIILDATDFDSVDNAFKQAGNVNGAVNFCGSLFLKPAHLTSKEQFEHVVAASLITAFATVRAAAKNMTGGGSVVLISSAAALQGLANHEAIAAAKAGVVGLTLSAAATYAPQNLRFNSVAPGLTDTKLTRSITANDTARKFSESMHALKRIGSADEVARAVCFLLDPANSWITGQVLAVDGGLSSIQPKIPVTK